VNKPQPKPDDAPRKGGVLIRSEPMTIRVNAKPASAQVIADQLTTPKED
jgi:hypothetical protein